jgi:hypothetical protein
VLETLGYRRRQAQKSLPLGAYPHRDEQFRIIAELKQQYFRAGEPVISRDTKKKEDLGNFHRPGSLWTILKAMPILFEPFLPELNYILIPQSS